MEQNTTTEQNNQGTEIRILDEIQDMLEFIYKKGIKIPDNISQQSLTNQPDPNGAASLVADYNALTAAILPSTPESIKFIGKEFIGNIGNLSSWKIPVVKKYVTLTIFGLAALIAVSLMPQVTAENQDKGILSLNGMALFVNLMFICLSALLGVMFFILKTIKEKIDTFTLIQVDVFSFNISIIIGIVSGFIISELFNFNSTIMGSSVEVHKMTLALLGGFASDAIFTILHNIVNKIKLLFAA